MKEDIVKIKSSDQTFISTEKKKNFYQISKDDHNKILLNNIRKTYKKVETSLPTKIYKKAKQIAKKFEIADKVDIIGKRQCLVTLAKQIEKKFETTDKLDIIAKCQWLVTFKDHKDSFRANPNYRLLNPTKSELDKLSQHIQQQINTAIRSSLNVNMWQISSKVIKWFKNIKNNNLYAFTILIFKIFIHPFLKYFEKFNSICIKINRYQLQRY